jgi:hypothetical protein
MSALLMHPSHNYGLRWRTDVLVVTTVMVTAGYRHWRSLLEVNLLSTLQYDGTFQIHYSILEADVGLVRGGNSHWQEYLHYSWLVLLYYCQGHLSLSEAGVLSETLYHGTHLSKENGYWEATLPWSVDGIFTTVAKCWWLLCQRQITVVGNWTSHYQLCETKYVINKAGSATAQSIGSGVSIPYRHCSVQKSHFTNLWEPGSVHVCWHDRLSGL